MLAYYFELALRSFRRNRVLTALMVLAIALGIGASMTTLTVFHVLSGDPLPGHSQTRYRVQLDPHPMSGYTPGEEPTEQVTRYDAERLLREARGDRQALMTTGRVAIEPDRADIAPFYARTRYASADFFPMFDVPFRAGRGWTAQDDEAEARVVVISEELATRLFADQDPVGRPLRLNETEFRIIGVLDHWRPAPRFYDLAGSDAYDETELLFLPFSTSRALSFGRTGNMDCWGDTGGNDTGPEAPCVWMQYWVQLDTPARAAEYRRYLENYSEEQRAAGRYERPTNVRLRNVTEWLDYKQVVPGDVRLQVWLAGGFLLVCLVNTVGLLLAKFLRRAPEIGVRRALGASRRDIFVQLLVEAGTLGLAGGLAGLLLALLGLWAVRQQPADYAALAHMDAGMLALTFALALVASLLAGLVPAWRACQVAPARQLKSQ
ncbi:ABC transporter permease [Coralloluteibacterium thermophilus]|uniref:ABC transporter permease n=1 Tax=Coralloluteibacterium thermophilum TaxID=2707049 RepID=A0ABV9NL46_9GAMM